MLKTCFQHIFFYPGFCFTSIHESQDCRGIGMAFPISSLPLPPPSQALRHWPRDYCRELTSAHSQQPDSNREPLVSERKSLTTKLRALLTTKLRALKIKILENKGLHLVYVFPYMDLTQWTFLSHKVNNKMLCPLLHLTQTKRRWKRLLILRKFKRVYKLTTFNRIYINTF